MNKNLTDAYKMVLKDMVKNGPGFFVGKYDATNGNKHFMYGIETVMEFISYKAEQEDFDNLFLENLGKSEKRA